MRAKESLEPGEWAVLALLAERPTHGFAIGRELSPEGEVGRVWAFPRPLVYRALETLRGLELAEPQRIVTSTLGPNRTIVRATPAGRRRVAAWLEEPVEHVRDVRSLLMLKLAFRTRRGLPLSPLLQAQRELLAPVVEGLERLAGESVGFERVLALWRLEAALAVLRFLDSLRAVETDADAVR